MALEDFEPAGASTPPPPPPKRRIAPEDEDLFDFEVVEMKLEPEADRRRTATVSAHGIEPPPPEYGTPAPAAPARAAAAPGAARSETPAQAQKAAEAQEAREIAEAETLVEDLETALGEGRTRRRPMAGAVGAAAAATSSTTWLVLGAIALANLGGLFFLWNTSRAFQGSLDELRKDFLGAVGASAAAGDVRHEARRPENAHSGPKPVADASGEPSVPLEAFEKSALELARAELAAGEHGAARRRLARLLAVADRIESAERAEIEAQASFLFAASYRAQAAHNTKEQP